MPLICYREKKFLPAHLSIINQANQIIENYRKQGYDLTLRQLYYQFVSKDLISNNVREYKNLGSIVNDGRMAGLIDWDAIVDRTRNVKKNSHWESPADILKSAASSFSVDKWATQKVRFEVWIEKDALIGVIEDTCKELDIPYFSCRGYTSQSEMWGAAMRYKKAILQKQGIFILHLGDHDPSGMDMTRDVRDRISGFLGTHLMGDVSKIFKVFRLALHKEQVDDLNLPPNPAKLTDSRAKGYVEQYGDESWELDAMEPDQINSLITENVMDVRDAKLWNEQLKIEKAGREKILKLAKGI